MAEPLRPSSLLGQQAPVLTKRLINLGHSGSGKQEGHQRLEALVFAKVNLTLSLLPLIATPRLAREAFFSADLPDEELRAYWQLMQDESYMALLDMVALDLPKPVKVKTPLLILGVARDNMLKPSEIEATARAYHAQVEIIPDVAHNSMLEPRWQTVAERILVWLQ